MLFARVYDRFERCHTLRQGRFGVIETSAGRLDTITIKSWPKLLAWPGSGRCGLLTTCGVQPTVVGCTIISHGSAPTIWH